MQKTLMEGLNEKDMQAVIRTYDLKPYYYPTLFPLRETKFLTWKQLEAQAGLKIAADIIARGATIPRKTREAIERLQGQIPKLGVSREKNEDALEEYDLLMAMANGASDLEEIVRFWAEDVKFCWDAIAARLEWVALRSISLGKVDLNSLNNAAVVSEFDADYQIPSEQKIGVVTSYAGATNGSPLTNDFPKALAIGKKMGVTYKYAFMNVETFGKLASQEEVIKRTSTIFQNLSDIRDTPSKDAVNRYLDAHKEKFKGLEVILVDQDITIEHADGTRTTGNPFEDDVILFSESKQLGNTFWKRPVEAKDMSGDVSVKAMRGHTLIRKYSNLSPVTEITEGITNAFPAWNLARRSLLMQTDATTWNKN